MMHKFGIFCFTFIFKIMLTVETCDCDEIYALILARGGSKGISDKNLVEIEGKSILGRAIRTIQNTGLFEHVWVSTDSDKIANEAVKYGAVVHRRPEIFAQDNTTSLESVKEFLSEHHAVDKFALFQCTSVFLNEKYISEAFEKAQEKGCVFAATRSHKLRWTRRGSKLVPLNFDMRTRPRRQDWEGELLETGMFYFSTRDLIEQNQFQNENCSVVEIAARDALEIDDLYDLQLARCLADVEATNSTNFDAINSCKTI